MAIFDIILDSQIFFRARTLYSNNLFYLIITITHIIGFALLIAIDNIGLFYVSS